MSFGWCALLVVLAFASMRSLLVGSSNLSLVGIIRCSKLFISRDGYFVYLSSPKKLGLCSIDSRNFCVTPSQSSSSSMLWGGNWRNEFLNWSEEENAKWTTVSRSHKKKTFAQVVRMPPKSDSVSSRLCFPKNYDPDRLPNPVSPVHGTSSLKKKSIFNHLCYPADYYSKNFGSE